MLTLYLASHPVLTASCSAFEAFLLEFFHNLPCMIRDIEDDYGELQSHAYEDDIDQEDKGGKDQVKNR